MKNINTNGGMDGEQTWRRIKTNCSIVVFENLLAIF